jgi:uroporphyrinogen decarboxylase
MISKERVQCVLDARPPDRPPFSLWRHFSREEQFGPAAVEAHLRHHQTYQPDFMKVMNDNGYPYPSQIQSVKELSSLGLLRGDEEKFQRQLDLIRELRRRVGPDTPMITTIFNALATLRGLVRPPAGHGPPQMDAAADGPAAFLRQMVKEDRAAFKSAIVQIGKNLAVFAHRCLEAGADGIYLSVRDDWLDLTPADKGQYDDLVRSSDLEIMAVISAGRFNLLHVCGRPVDLRKFASYPAQAMNWADRDAGPSISQVKGWMKPAICCGVNNLTTLPRGKPQDVQKEVADALHQAGSRPIMISPGCTYDPNTVPEANLQAIGRAVRAIGG